MGLPPTLSPRPGGQGRRLRLMPRRASVEDGPDSQPDPQSPGPARTLKRSSRRHRPSARRPPAPLLSGFLSAHAQRRGPPRLRSQQACASVRAGSAGTPAQAQTGTARRPPPLPHSLKSFKAAPSNNNLPPSGDTSVTEGLLPQGALTLLTLSLYCVTASSECPKTLGAQRATTEEPPQPKLRRYRPLWGFRFFHWATVHAPGGPRWELSEVDS